MSKITPAHFVEFAEAYLGERVRGMRQESSHFLIKADGLRRPLLVDTHHTHLPDRILNSLLHVLGVDSATFEELAGTRQQLKQYVKSQKRNTQVDPATAVDP